MKLRIRGNSLRLRLGQSEVRQLAADGRVEEYTSFGPGVTHRFHYSLIAFPGKPDVRASFSGRSICVYVAHSAIQQWATSDQVGISASQRLGGEELSILIEKDFQCIDAPATESQEDAFPHPGPAAGDCAATLKN